MAKKYTEEKIYTADECVAHETHSFYTMCTENSLGTLCKFTCIKKKKNHNRMYPAQFFTKTDALQTTITKVNPVLKNHRL